MNALPAAIKGNGTSRDSIYSLSIKMATSMTIV